MDLQKQIETTIKNNKRHQDYDDVCKLADKYYAFIVNKPRPKKDKKGKIVGEDYPLNDYLRQFVRREDEDLFEQRKNLTKHHVPSICSQIMKPFNKVVKSNRVVKLIDNKDAKAVDAIESALEKFYGESKNNGVDQFLNERFKILTFTDPNAWLNISFDPFDPNTEKPSPYPIEYSCKDVIDFEVKNDQTLWVIIQGKYSYTNKKDEIKSSDRYVIYGKDEAFEYKLKPDEIKEVPAFDSIWTNPKDNKQFFIKKYEHKSGRVPMMRVGYIKDISTNNRTYVNPFHYEALPLMEQFLKVSSELQLSITLHAFPKQVTYVSPCDNKGCTGGTMSGGGECSVCSGTGKKVHSTSADIIELPLPDPKRMGEMVDASNISSYIPFPGGVMEFLDKYADKIEKKIMRMMYNSESIVQTTFNTATEATYDMESVYDTLNPFGDKYSEVWMFYVGLVAVYLDFEKNTTVWHQFPSDLKMKTLNQLLEDLKSANDSNAPSYIRESINNDILEIIYADDQKELSKLKIKNRHFPFPGKSETEVQSIILNNLTSRFNQVLYANFDLIFEEIEIENEKFYDMTIAKQKELINKKVEAMVTLIDGSVSVLNLRTA